MVQRKNVWPLLVSLLALLLLTTEEGEAQNNPTNDDIAWEYVTPTLEGEPGERVVFRFKGGLKPGIHLYSERIYPDSIFGPSPTEQTSGGSEVVVQAGKMKADKSEHSSYDENFETETSYWKEPVIFSVPFTISENATPGSTEEVFVNVYHQTCDGNSCKPPFDSRFDFTVKILEPEPEEVAIDTAAVRDSLHRVIVASVLQIVETIDEILTTRMVASPIVSNGDLRESTYDIYTERT